MKFLKALLFSTVMTVLTLAAIFCGIILWEHHEKTKAHERQVEIQQIVEERVRPLEKRILELESKGK